jgi:hypothetical protein
MVVVLAGLSSVHAGPEGARCSGHRIDAQPCLAGVAIGLLVGRALRPRPGGVRMQTGA